MEKAFQAAVLSNVKRIKRKRKIRRKPPKNDSGPSPGPGPDSKPDPDPDNHRRDKDKDDYLTDNQDPPPPPPSPPGAASVDHSLIAEVYGSPPEAEIPIVDKVAVKLSSTLTLDDIPRFAKALTPETIEQDALDILKVARPYWFLPNETNPPITTEVLNGSVTNQLFVFFRPVDPEPKDKIVIKIYGDKSDSIRDVDEEIDALNRLCEYQAAPQLYAAFDNGICYEFIHGKTLEKEEIKSPQVYPLVADEVAKLHSIPLEDENETKGASPEDDGGSGTVMWDKMRQMVDVLEKDTFVEQHEIKMKMQTENQFMLSKVKEHIDDLEKMLEKQGMPIAFCHNDLDRDNMIYNKRERKVKLIDFEHAMPNYAPYDVANYFNELSKPDYNGVTVEQMYKKGWIDEYMKTYGSEIGMKMGFTQKEFERWVNMTTPASHLYWALWAAVQAGGQPKKQQKDLGFDFVKYSGLRYNRFQKTMRELSVDDVSI